jgi:serine/threonine protein kinase
MDTDREKRVLELLSEALELPPGERYAHLEETCGGDEELLQEVLACLDGQTKISDFLELPAVEEIASRGASESKSEAAPPPATPLSSQHGRPAPPAPNLRLGRPAEIGPYHLLDILGEGGMGVVYRAEDTRLKRPVAIKFLARNLLSDRVAKKRFLREAKAASKIDHPNTCTIYEITETEDGQPYIVMAHYDGESLKERLEDGPLNFDDATRVVSEVGAGLARIHRAEIIHRDVKPGNVFLTHEGPIKILDFGIAKAAEDSILTRKGRLIGTPGYMSPEQTRGEADQRSDVWALGVLFYEMLTGRRPFHRYSFKDELRAIVNEPVPSILDELPDAPPNVVRTVQGALTKDPGERFQTVDEMLGSLHGEETTRVSVSKIPPPATAAEPAWKRWLVPFLAGLLLAGAFGVGGCWLMQP